MGQANTVFADEALMRTDLHLPGRRQGKVRDIYETSLKDGRAAVVIIATDRVSAFDVVMANGLPGKGVILTQISRFWFDQIRQRLGDQIAHHLVSTDAADIPDLTSDQIELLQGRVMIGRKTEVVPIECVVRGYLAGSGWAEYQKAQSVCGVELPAGLTQCAKLPEPVFTPATKAATGHDENISFQTACGIVGADLMATLREVSLAIYKMGHDLAAQRGIILADTKFEFGHADDGSLLLIDEVLTPDSSRFWPADRYEDGRDQESYDKQYVRNYLQELVDAGQWDKTPPGPELPGRVVRDSLAKYRQAYFALTGQEIEL